MVGGCLVGYMIIGVVMMSMEENQDDKVKRSWLRLLGCLVGYVMVMVVVVTGISLKGQAQ